MIFCFKLYKIIRLYLKQQRITTQQFYKNIMNMYLSLYFIET